MRHAIISSAIAFLSAVSCLAQAPVGRGGYPQGSPFAQKAEQPAQSERVNGFRVTDRVDLSRSTYPSETEINSAFWAKRLDAYRPSSKAHFNENLPNGRNITCDPVEGDMFALMRCYSDAYAWVFLPKGTLVRKKVENNVTTFYLHECGNHIEKLVFPKARPTTEWGMKKVETASAGNNIAVANASASVVINNYPVQERIIERPVFVDRVVEKAAPAPASEPEKPSFYGPQLPCPKLEVPSASSRLDYRPVDAPPVRQPEAPVVHHNWFYRHPVATTVGAIVVGAIAYTAFHHKSDNQKHDTVITGPVTGASNQGGLSFCF